MRRLAGLLDRLADGIEAVYDAIYAHLKYSDVRYAMAVFMLATSFSILLLRSERGTIPYLASRTPLEFEHILWIVFTVLTGGALFLVVTKGFEMLMIGGFPFVIFSMIVAAFGVTISDFTPAIADAFICYLLLLIYARYPDDEADNDV